MPDCGKRIDRKGVCKTHYERQREGKSLIEPIRRQRIPQGATCAFPDCGKPEHAKQLCQGHYMQQYNGKPLKPLRIAVVGAQPCSFCGCINIASGRTLCHTHAQQDRHGEQLRPLRFKLSAARSAELRAQNLYWCLHCEQILPLERFVWNRKIGKPQSGCKLCRSMHKKARTFNVSLEFVRELFELQNHACAICNRRHGDPNKGEDSDWLHLDHDHRRCIGDGAPCGKCVRGLLCGNCNARGLAWYEEIRSMLGEIELFERYLQAPPAQILYARGLA
ncbi:endonuclease domain-containing protein [Embleya sp. NPDC005575]|uniref:endonuclease domain-containing protein n=1 Tax=Embleya sp. NPDC005575 TaxID=3156892 RepID=UPI00339E5ADA